MRMVDRFMAAWLVVVIIVVAGLVSFAEEKIPSVLEVYLSLVKCDGDFEYNLTKVDSKVASVAETHPVVWFYHTADGKSIARYDYKQLGVEITGNDDMVILASMATALTVETEYDTDFEFALYILGNDKPWRFITLGDFLGILLGGN